KDIAKITKKWPKPDKNEHEIVKSIQKLDSKTFLIDPFVFIRHADPTKMIMDDIENRNEGSGGVGQENHSEGDERVGQEDNAVVNEEFQATVADKPEVKKKRRRAAGASVEIGSTTVTTAPFVTSSVALTSDHEGGGNIESVFGPNLQTQHSGERFVISSDSSHHSNTNVVDAEVTSVVRSPIPPPPIITTAVATTAVADTFYALTLEAESSADNYYVTQEMDTETLQQIYVPKWNVINNFALDDPKVCHNMIDQLAPSGLFSQLRDMDYNQLFAEFDVGAAHQTCLSAAVSSLEGTCSGLRNQVSGYELFKEQLEAVQDAQVKILSDRVVDLDSELMDMAVHLDEEFYPRFLTIISDRRWIISRMQTGLVVGIDHKMAGRGLAEVTTYDPFNEANITNIMDSLCLEGPSAETPEGSRLQHVYEQLLLPIYWMEDNAIIAMGPLVDPLSFENLVGEASTSGVPATATTNIALSVSVTTANVSSIPPISMADYKVLNAKPRAKTSHFPKIIFEQETLETSPKHPTTIGLL
nr:hypothetical protein [Tanacetum cinerariifolium]